MPQMWQGKNCLVKLLFQLQANILIRVPSKPRFGSCKPSSRPGLWLMLHALGELCSEHLH